MMCASQLKFYPILILGALVGTSGFDLITNVETPDDLTTVLTYSEPYPGYLDQFSYGLFPRHATGEPADMAKPVNEPQPCYGWPVHPAIGLLVKAFLSHATQTIMKQANRIWMGWYLRLCLNPQHKVQ